MAAKKKTTCPIASAIREAKQGLRNAYREAGKGVSEDVLNASVIAVIEQLEADYIASHLSSAFGMMPRPLAHDDPTADDDE